MAIQQLLQSKHSGLDPRTAALIQMREAAEVLKQSASPVTPSGQPTVASQDIQQAMSMTQPQMDLRALMPGIRQQAAEMAQAQQPVTQAQLQQAMAQRAAPGIAGLPADVNMAEGGIVGFAVGGSPEETVSSEEAAALDELRVAEAKRKRDEAERLRQLEFLRLAGAPQVAQYEESAPATYESMKDTWQVPPGRYAEPAPTQRPPASTPSASAAPSGVIDYADILNKMLGAQTEGFRKLEELAKPQPKTQEEIDFVKRQEEEVARRRAGLESRRQQYLDLERMREEAGKTTGLQDLAAFLSRAGGARSLFAGLGQAARTQADIDAARRKEKQAAIDRRQQYFDLLEQQRDAIEDRDVAIRQGQMDRARAAQDRLQDITRSIAALRVQTASQMYGPTIQAGQHAQSTAQQIASQEKRARERNAALAGIAALKAGSKTAPLPGLNEIFKLEAELSTQFNPKNPGPKGLEYLEKVAPQLHKDIVNGNIKPDSDQWKKEVAPKLAIGAQIYKNNLLSQTKYGAQPMSYSAAASAVGLEDEED